MSEEQHIIGERYEIRRGLGSGSMGSVYLAFDPKVSREVAVKILRKEFAKSEKHRQRFEREARAIAALRHPNVVEIYDYGGSPEEHLYLVMEYVRGQNLGKLLEANGPLPEPVLAACGLELGAALQHAHEHGVIHRDIKPENVFLDRGRIVLVDFGIVKAIAPENPLGADAARSRTDVIGTPGFMAPEQIEQKPLDARTDLFAFGALLYFLAANKLPFEADSPYALVEQFRTSRAAPITFVRQDLSEEMRRIIHDCLEVDPKLRPSDAKSVRDRLRPVLQRYGVSDARDVLAQYESNPSGLIGERRRTTRRSAKHSTVATSRVRRSLILAVAALVVTAAIGLLSRDRFADPEPEAVAAVLPTQTLVKVRSRQRTHVWVNGVALGATPSLAPAPVPSGKQTFEFVSDKGRLKRELELPRGGTVVVNVDWKKKKVQLSTGDETAEE
jgi:serine/threonine protein kinase